MKSLLLLGFPRGFTDETHRIVSAMVPQFQAPLMIDGEVLHGGELLNSDRCVGLTQYFDFFLHPQDPQFEAAYQVFAERLSAYTENHLIKDVVQPYAVMRFLVEHPDVFTVVFVDRPAEHILYAQWKKGWSYMENPRTLRTEMLNFPRFDVSRALHDEAYTSEFFSARYPGALPARYLDEDFTRRRDAFAAEYREPIWINNFQRIREYESFSFEGFDAFERDLSGHWSLQHEASILVRVDAAPPVGASIQLRLQLPGCLDRPSLVRFETRHGGVTAITLEPGAIALVELPFSEHDCEHGVLAIRVHNQHLYQPGSMPDIDETRTLGVSVIGIAAFRDAVDQASSGGGQTGAKRVRWHDLFRSAKRGR